MKVEKIIKQRLSTRSFCDKSIPQVVINSIIDAGRLAPSVKNMQPWLYVQLNKTQKSAVVEELLRVAEEKENSLRAYMIATALAVSQAPVLILVFCTQGDINYERSYLLSIGASIENCILRATELGIQSLWNCDITFIKKDFFKKLLNINYDLIAGISLGYAANIVKTKQKKKLEDVFIVNED